MSEIGTDRLFADVKVLLADVEELILATAGLAGDRVIELRERLQRKLAEGQAALAQCEADLRAQGEEAKACAIQFLREESWARLAAAAALGFLVGLALRRLR